MSDSPDHDGLWAIVGLLLLFDKVVFCSRGPPLQNMTVIPAFLEVDNVAAILLGFL